MDEYTYTPLLPGQFRLLHILPDENDETARGQIRCRLSHHEIDDDRLAPYVAVSYTWGPEPGGQDILVDGSRMYARPNLCAGLRSLRHHRFAGYVWIDAICINQRDDDDVEKTAQLALMGRIYARARCVAICLRSTYSPGPGPFFDAVERFWRCFDASTNTADGADRCEVYEAVQWLAHNPYFRRVWIVQENILAADRVLLTDTRKVPWVHVERMVQLSRVLVPDEVSQESLDRQIRESGLEMIVSGMAPYNIKAKAEPPAPTLFNTLARYRQQQCFDRRDRILGFLGLPEMRKPKIQDMFRDGYMKSAEEMLFDVLEWFERSPALTGRHQTSLQRYSLLQDILGDIQTSSITYEAEDLHQSASLADRQYEMKLPRGCTARLPLIITDANYKGTILTISNIDTPSTLWEEGGDSVTFEQNDFNLKLLERLKWPLLQESRVVGYQTQSEEAAFKLFEPGSGKKEDPPHSIGGWRKVGLSCGGWGIASSEARVGDSIWTVTVDQTQNNTSICHSFVLRENDKGLYTFVSHGLDHLGFHSPLRQRPMYALVSRMPPRRSKEDRRPNIKMALDPMAALQVTAVDGLQTLGHGWITDENRTW